MARTHNSFKPKRSKKAGRKTAKLLKHNYNVMKQLLSLLLILVFLVGCETPYKIIETHTTDSLGRSVKIVQKIYSKGVTIPQVYVNESINPLYYNPWYNPYFLPRVIIPAPRIVVPIRPIPSPRVSIPHRH
jgi:hypothetical protein